MSDLDEQFEHELEICRSEVEGSLQLLYGYLTVHAVAARDEKVLASLNKTPLFWNTCIYGLQNSFIIGLGRIFDQKSKHNLDKIIRLAQDNSEIFSKESLAKRKRKGSSNADEWLGDNLKKVHVPSPTDFRRLRKLVKKYRKIYQSNYRDLRRRIFAHREASQQSEIDQLFRKTNILEMQKLFIFVYKIYKTLCELYHNGKKPILRPMRFSVNQFLHSNTKKWQNGSLQERMVWETRELLGILSESNVQQSR